MTPSMKTLALRPNLEEAFMTAPLQLQKQHMRPGHCYASAEKLVKIVPILLHSII